ncbi:unnamed protein product [Blepharisma stoltei]|uniref:BZIP domain-containing protein n=1 Tax=Blepharisma stoltei TaxID=1481888 RepID=A0AAU9IS34_9CILI|nr:unnamed protein product [Blepharisma stoltei]
MTTLDFEKFPESLDPSSYSYDEKVSTNTSPFESEDLNDDLSLHNIDLDFRIPASVDSWPAHSSLSLGLDYNPIDSTPTYLCTICQKNIVKFEDPLQIPKKRKRFDDIPILPSMQVCEECRAMDLASLKDKEIPEKSKRVVKREHAKRRAMESEAVNKLKEEQKKLQEICKDLPDAERKRQQQMIRNRISAQQSRDRKKQYISLIEDENSQLKKQNSCLQHKVMQLQAENDYLKNQLASIHMSDSSSNYSKITKAAGLAFAAMISVMMIMNLSIDNSSQNTALQLSSGRKLVETTNFISEYTNPQEEISEKAIGVINSQLQKYTPVQFHETDFIDIRQERIKKSSIKSSLRALGASDPCSRQMMQEVSKGSLTTLFCPAVQVFWENDQEVPSLQNLQVIMPLDNLPSLAPAKIDPDKNYLVELMCKVTDVNLLPA